MSYEPDDDDSRTVMLENCMVLAKSEKALLIRQGEHEFWVPKSVVRDDGELSADAGKFDTGTLALPFWLAEAKDAEFDEV